jgi:hypothetical protein
MAFTEVTARYSRKVQVAQYEPAEAEVTIRAQIIEGEDGDKVIGTAMGKAKLAVNVALGLVKPAEKPPAPVAQPAPDAGKVDSGTPTAPAAPDKAAEIDMGEVKEPAKRGPGRPPKPKADPASMDDFDAPAAKVVISDTELQAEASKTAQRLGGPDAVKKLMKDKYKIARLAELTEKDRTTFVADLAALKSEK